MDSDDLESWRIYFRTSGCNIFTVINKAIMVAAKDYALDLKLRRDQITCLLYHHCCPCNQPEFSAPLEGAKVCQPNADAYCRSCLQVDDHSDKNRRVGHVDSNLSEEPNKSLMVELNGEKNTVHSGDVVHGSNKETGAARDENRSQRVEHQEQPSLLMAKSTAVQQSSDSEKLGSDGVSNRKEVNFLDHRNKNGYLQDGPNRNINVVGNINSENEGFDGIPIDKDGDVLEGQNKSAADKSAGFKKRVRFVVNTGGKHGEFFQGPYKDPDERIHCAVDGEVSGFRMDGSSFEQARAAKDLIHVGDETCKEVLKAKTILEDWQNQSDMVLQELLAKLESFDINVRILQVTLIGRAVQPLRKHGTKQIRDVAHSLIRKWKAKVDEWIHVNAPIKEDQLPSRSSNEGDTVDPTLGELLQGFEDVDETRFLSILSPENIQGNLAFNQELSFVEEELLQICTNPGRTDMSEKIREEELRQPMPLLKSSGVPENKQLPSGKNELERFDNTKIMKGEDCMKKLGNCIPVKKPRSKGNRTSRVCNNAFTKHGALSSLQVHNLEKLKQTADGKGRIREEGLVTERYLTSNSQLKAKELPKERNNAIFELKKVGISQSNELQKVEETRRKLQEGYKDGKDVNKRRAIDILDVNHHPPSQELKRQKFHHARRDFGYK